MFYSRTALQITEPLGGYEEVTGFLVTELAFEYRRLEIPYFIPKTALVKPHENESGYSPDVLIINQTNLSSEPLWEKESTVTLAASIPLVVEVVSTNWRTDYYCKRGIYEEIGIPSDWIVEDTALDGFPGLKQVSVDYLALGGQSLIGNPKEPTISIYYLVGSEYQITQFRGGDRIQSPTLRELNLTADQIFKARR